MNSSLSNDETDMKTSDSASGEEVGLDEAQFTSCLESGKYDTHIQEDIDNANATGGRGTPWSIVVAENGKISIVGRMAGGDNKTAY